jgi:hypothetical protein
LASALDLVPDMPDGSALFTDWSLLGHPPKADANTVAFAGQLRSVDDQLQRDLGIRSTNAQWELDMTRAHQPPVVLLSYSAPTDLSDLPGKLTHFGYHADGPLLTRTIDAGTIDQEHMWMFGLRNVGIDPARRLLVAGSDAAAVRTVLSAPNRPTGHLLGHAGPVAPLLALASTRLGRIATASTAVGSAACVSPANLVGKQPTPLMLAAVRKQFTGTFTRPQAEIIALANPAATTALDALTFPDQGTARANQPGRSAAARPAAP